MATINFNDKEFQKRLNDLQNRIMPSNVQQRVHNVATEVLRLSSFEVPHDKGLLQDSGNVEDYKDESIVGYNKVYAARLHENPQFKFQKGRKGKYLEDPIKNNLRTFIKYLEHLV